MKYIVRDKVLEYMEKKGIIILTGKNRYKLVSKTHLKKGVVKWKRILFHIFKQRKWNDM